MLSFFLFNVHYGFFSLNLKFSPGSDPVSNDKNVVFR